MRDHLNREQLHAHDILDDVRAGLHHTLKNINWALRVLGEPVGQS